MMSRPPTVTVSVAVTLGSELVNLGAALYGGHHGAPPGTVLASSR